MHPRTAGDWIDDPDDIEVDIKAEYEDSNRRGATYENLAETLSHVAAVSRPDFLDEWDRVIAVTNGYTPRDDAQWKSDADFDAAEAFDYCYRYVTRQGAIYLSHVVAAQGENERGDFDRRPWSPRWDGRDPYQNPVELFTDIMSGDQMPPTPFMPIGEGQNYTSLDDLYEDLVSCDKLALRDHEGDWYVTPRTAWIDPKREEDDDVPLLPDR
ncbi:hypothetical protein [Natrinema thermotolerans]|nr:hypothetical protein [Natrinema thermotolerans]QCC60217.1 hypothetical protein DVR14_16905 [Natrinema thermotolerans]QCC61127.1 hypothetical protein DVR14_21025 [Natrinema thermotolerans]